MLRFLGWINVPLNAGRFSLADGSTKPLKFID
jgi:hypothetical protein